MFRAFGMVIILYAISQFFSNSFSAVDETAVAVLETVETAAQVSTAQLEKASELQ